jgi:hypothetical protein
VEEDLRFAPQLDRSPTVRCFLYACYGNPVCVTPEAASRLSPYLNGHLKRFGQYVLDMAIQPEPLELKTLFGTRA